VRDHADVQAEAELDLAQPAVAAAVVDHRDAVEGVDGGIQRRLADLGFVLAAADLEDDEDGVADELQDLAALRRSRRGAVLEVIVQQLQQLAAGSDSESR
jgi:hypothetical protein